MSKSSVQKTASFEALRKHKDSGWAVDTLAKQLTERNAAAAPTDLSFLERRFPHIVLKLLEVWGTRDCAPYLNSLICDDRGDRQGFPAGALQDLLMLSSVYDEYPETPDNWGHVRHASPQAAGRLKTQGKFSLYQVNGRQLRLDSPISTLQLEELRQVGLLDKSALKHGANYFGVSTKDGVEQVSRWNEPRNTFSSPNRGLSLTAVEELDYAADDRGLPVFIPLMEADPQGL